MNHNLAQDNVKTISSRSGFQRRKPSLLALEARLMFDGAAVATAAADLTLPAEVVESSMAEPPALPVERVQEGAQALLAETHEIVFVDVAVTDWQVLVSGVSPEAEVIVLDPARDGLIQIAEVLQGRSNLNAVHIFSHGADGELILGEIHYSVDSLGQYQQQLSDIGQALSVDGDILLYGCDIAQGSAGEVFIGAIAEATSADVAASSNTTGDAVLGGDWNLEASVGKLETTAISVDAYGGVLAPSDPPVIDLDASASGSGYSTSYTVGGATASIADVDIRITDNRDVRSVTITIVNHKSGDILTAGALPAGIVATEYNAATGNLALLGAASPDDYEIAIRAVQFSNTNASPNTDQRNVSVVVNSTDAKSSTPVTARISVVSNVAPIARRDIYAAVEDGSLVVNAASGVLANDTDANHDALTASVVSGPAHGTVTLNSDGSFTYTPNADFYGADSFTYQANDGALDSSPATVSINVATVNDAPTLSSDTTYLMADITEDVSASAPVQVSAILASGGYADVDHNALSGLAITAVSGNGTWQYSINGVLWRDFGNVSASNALLLSANAVIRYIPDGVQGETASLTYRAWDQTSGQASSFFSRHVGNSLSNGGSTAYSTNTGQVSLTVSDVNDAPRGSDRDISINEDATYVVKVSDFGFQDVDGGSFSSVIVNQPTAGTLYLDGVAVSTATMVAVADISAGRLTYRPAQDANGNNYGRFSFQVRDDQGTVNGGRDIDPSVNWLRFDVAAVNDAPVASIELDAYTATEQTPLSLKGTGLSISDVDAHNDWVTASLSVGEGALTVNAGNSGVLVLGNGTSTVTMVGSVGQINALLGAGSTSSLSYLNDSDKPVTATTLRLTVNDLGNNGSGGQLLASDTATINIAAVNDAPRIDIVSVSTFSAGDDIVIPYSGSASPSPATLDVSGLGGTVTKVTVSLAISHTWPEDVDILLVGPNGQTVVLMSDAGGGSDLDKVTLVFDDSAGAAVPFSGIVSGTYRPANYVGMFGGDPDSYPGAPTGNHGSSLSVFNGQNPNGVWSLYVVDDTGGDRGLISDWGITFTTEGATTTYTENSAPIVINDALVLSDVDDTQLVGATVSIGGMVAGDVLGFTNQNGIQGGYDAASGVLTLTGTATLAQYQAALRSVTFSSSSDSPTAGGLSTTRTITWSVTDADSDGVGPQTGGTSTTIEVIAVNDAPVTNGDIADQTAVAGGAFELDLPDGLFSDVDVGDTLTYAARLSNGDPLPAWLVFDPDTQTFSGTPSNTDVGVLSVEIVARDAGGATARIVFDLNVVASNAFVQEYVDTPSAGGGPFGSSVGTGYTPLNPGRTYGDFGTGEVPDPSLVGTNTTPVFNPEALIESAPTAAGLLNEGEGKRLELAAIEINGKIDDFVVMVPSGTLFNFALPDAFVQGEEKAEYIALQMNGEPLPAWLYFDPVTGKFIGKAPKDMIGTLRIQLTGKDAKGVERAIRISLTVDPAVDSVREAPTGNQQVEASSRLLARSVDKSVQAAGRAGLSEQIKMAAKRGGESANKAVAHAVL